jgi:hypothetical protein
MARLEDFLRRFRPLVAPPGVAGPGAVPPDRTADLLAELADVLSAIDVVEDQAIGLEAAARAAADERLSVGRSEAAGSIALARERAPGERAAAYAEWRQAGETEIAGALEAAGQEALRIGGASGARLPALTEAVVERVLDGASD